MSDPAIGKLYNIGKGSNHQESQCQWKGCHRTAVREVSRSNTPGRDGLEDWIALCPKHYKQALPLRREVLARMVDQIRLRRNPGKVTFR